MAHLQVQGLHKTFDGITAVNDLSFDVQRNEIYAIIGPNGAGKTTTFNLLSGVLSADRGKNFFDGNEILGLPPHDIARRGMVRTFQTVSLSDIPNASPCLMTMPVISPQGTHDLTHVFIPIESRHI